MATVILVAAAGEMANRPVPADEVCLEGLFDRCCCYADLAGDRWVVLLGSQPLVARPEEIIPAGARDLSGMNADDHTAWSRQVLAWVQANVAKTDTVVFIGDEERTHQVAQWLMLSGYAVNQPLEWQSLRYKLDWLRGRIWELEGATVLV